MKNVESFDLLGVRVAVTNLGLTCDIIKTWIKEKNKQYICIAPVSTIVDCQKSEEYCAIVNGSGMTTPDGMPVVWMGRLLGKKNISRTYGPDLLPLLCEFGQEYGFRHYFYGGNSTTLEKLKVELKVRSPEIKIVGMYSPPLREVGFIEERRILDQIDAKKPDVLWVGLGSPKQDYWMRDHRSKLDAPVIIGVGAAFDFIAGTKKQAPEWMRKFGLEWFFRLCQEPKRLWKRYLVGNSYFVYLLLKKSFIKVK